MANGPNLFDLAAKISVDAKGVDKTLTDTQKHVKGLESDLKKLDRTALTSGTSLGTVERGASKFGSTLASIPAALTTVTVGLVALGGAATSIYQLATASAKLGGEIYDLSQQVNFGAETLSSLKVAAELSGGSLAGLSTSLGIFDRNMVSARQSGGEMSKLFRALKIDTEDNEKALRQTIKALSEMGDTEDQTAAAMKLFGRSGKEILGIVKETSGDVDKFTERMRELGLVLSNDAAKKADEFEDQLVMVQNQIDAIVRQVGSELIPIVSKAASDLSAWMRQNQGEIQRTASELSALVGWVYQVAKAIADVSPVTFIIRVVRQFADYAQSGPTSVAQSRDYRSDYRVDSQGNYSFFNRTTPINLAGLTGGAMGKVGRDFRLPGGGGGGGGGGAAKEDPGVNLLKQLQKELFNLRQHTKLEEIQEQLLEKQFAKTSDEIKKRIMISAIEIDTIKKILSLTRERYASEASYARFAEEEFIKSLGRVRALSQIERERFATRAGQNRPPWMDLGGGSTLGGEPGTLTRPRIATVEMQVMRERVEMQRQKIQALASDLTYAVDNAIRVGFEQGIKAGFASLLQSLLQMIHEIFLRQLAQGIAGILQGVMGGSGGGGGSLLGKIAGIAIGAAAAGFGGGGTGSLLGSGMAGGFGGGFAQGGFVPGVDKGFDSVPAMLRPGELVLNKDQQRQLGGNVTIIVYANDAKSFSSRDTKAQISRQYSRLLQKQTLMG